MQFALASFWHIELMVADGQQKQQALDNPKHSKNTED